MAATEAAAAEVPGGCELMAFLAGVDRDALDNGFEACVLVEKRPARGSDGWFDEGGSRRGERE